MSKPLPPNPNLDRKTQQLMSQAHYMLGRVDEAAAGLPDRTVLVTPTRYQEIQSTFALRGVPVATEKIAYVGLLGDSPGVKADDRIVRYVQFVNQAIRGLGSMSVGYALLRAATGFARLSDSSLSEDALPWRTTPHWFGDSLEGAYHHAVPPGADLNAHVEELVAWIDGTDDMPLVGKVAEGSFRLYTLAPFTHTSDLLHVYVALELIKAGALRDQIVAISVYIDRNRAQFQRVHHKAIETGDLNEWVGFFANGFIEQCQHQLNLVEQLGGLRDRNLTLVGDRRGDGFTRFVSSLASFEFVTAQLVAERCGFTVKYARDMIHRAERHGILTEVGLRKRNKVYQVISVRRLVDHFAGVVPAGDRTVHDE